MRSRVCSVTGTRGRGRGVKLTSDGSHLKAGGGFELWRRAAGRFIHRPISIQDITTNNSRENGGDLQPRMRTLRRTGRRGRDRREVKGQNSQRESDISV